MLPKPHLHALPPARHARLQLRAAAGLLAAATALLVACGGGGGDSRTPDTPPPPAATLSLLATGSSASNVSLGWSAVADAEAVTIDRRAAAADAAWTRIAELPGRSRHFVDDGLAPQTRYRYRVQTRRSGGNTLSAEGEATTDLAAPVVTALAAAGTPIGSGVVGAAGGRVTADDGSAIVDVPGGAFAQDTTLRLFAATNTAPDGIGSGLRIEAGALPSQPLRVRLAAGADVPAASALAVQRGDGSWLSLPPAAGGSGAVELAAPTLATSAPQAAGQAGPRAADGTLASWHVARYLSWQLKPGSATLRTGSSRDFVPYARVLAYQVFCDVDDELLCVPSPVLEPRELPILNDKPGYVREWRVQGVVGGNAGIGTVVPRAGAAGATYTAPQRAPDSNPVTLSFHTLHQASGRAMTLQASVQISEPSWQGNTRGYLGPGDIAFWFGSAATWRLVDSSGGVERFEAVGQQQLEVEDIICTGSASPSSAELPPGSLVIDRSVQPARYTLDLGSVWTSTITGSCPGHGSGTAPMTVPGRLIAEGTLDDDRRIEGETVMGGVRWDWFFVMP